MSTGWQARTLAVLTLVVGSHESSSLPSLIYEQLRGATIYHLFCGVKQSRLTNCLLFSLSIIFQNQKQMIWLS
jgi:hypothetical protein